MEKPTCDIDKLFDPKTFRALGDPQRVAILSDLARCCGGAKTVGEVAEGRPVHTSVVSRHLATLREAGLVECCRDGREAHYSVRYGDLISMLRTLADAIEACCPTADEPMREHNPACRSKSQGKEDPP